MKAARPRCLFTSGSCQFCTPLRLLSRKDFKKHVMTLRRLAAPGARMELFCEITHCVSKRLLNGAFSPFLPHLALSHITRLGKCEANHPSITKKGEYPFKSQSHPYTLFTTSMPPMLSKTTLFCDQWSLNNLTFAALTSIIFVQTRRYRPASSNVNQTITVTPLTSSAGSYFLEFQLQLQPRQQRPLRPQHQYQHQRPLQSRHDDRRRTGYES